MKQTVVITGASRGIGRAVALAFAEKSASKNNHEEYNIFVNCAKNSELLENVKKQIRDLGVCCESFTGDISNYNTAMEMFDEVHRHFGNVDILVNNAGISIIGLFQDMTRDEWDRIMNVNVGSVYNCCHFAIPDSFLSDEDKLSLFEEIPAGRMGRPDEAGKLAVMLADAPSYLTGQIITLDGAWI